MSTSQRIPSPQPLNNNNNNTLFIVLLALSFLVFTLLLVRLVFLSCTTACKRKLREYVMGHDSPRHRHRD